MGYFAVQWTALVVGFAAHVLLDRSPMRRTSGRVFELAALWMLVGMGVFNLWGGFGHIGPTSDEVAASIGYTQSMFQWEIGWADIALGVLGVLCARRAHRGQWTNATLVALTVSFYGDGIGHVVQWLGHANLAPNNIWAIPTCFLVPALSALFVVLARRRGNFSPRVPTRVADAVAA
jgi:hypothetical protein